MHEYRILSQTFETRWKQVFWLERHEINEGKKWSKEDLFRILNETSW